MTEAPVRLVLEPTGCETSIRRMTTVRPMSPWCPWDADDCSFLVGEGLRGREVAPLAQVRESVAEWVALKDSDPKRIEVMTEVYIQLALDHPSSAYALEFTKPDRTTTRLYRGTFTTYSRHGFPLDRWADDATPDPVEWHDNAMIAEQIVKSGIRIRSLAHLHRLADRLRRAS